MYKGKPKNINTKFVLSELDKIRHSVDKLWKALDLLYANVLFEEAKEYVKKCKIITPSKIQIKFKTGYLRCSYLCSMLENEGYITKKIKSGETMYVVNKNKFKE